MSEAFGIPRSTLQKKVKTDDWAMHKFGPATVLTSEEEAALVDWINLSAARGFPQSIMNIREGAASIAREFSREKTFKKEIPSAKWAKSFLQRHKELTTRKPELLAGASSSVRAEDLVGYFFYVDKYLEDQNLKHILQDPTRVVGADEMGVDYNPMPKKVVTEAGTRNVLMTDTSPPKSRISVMHTVSGVSTKIKTKLTFCGLLIFYSVSFFFYILAHYKRMLR